MSNTKMLSESTKFLRMRMKISREAVVKMSETFTHSIQNQKLN